MRKRTHEENEDDVLTEREAKRLRASKPDRLSSLSDELLLRTLSYLSRSDIVVCERLSRRLKRLAADGQVWRTLYYDRFVRLATNSVATPKRRLENDVARFRKLYQNWGHRETIRWFEEVKNIISSGKSTWKKQYRIRHNWSRGQARVKETEVAEQSSTPPLLVRLYGDLVFIADEKLRLRVWSLRDQEGLVAAQDLREYASGELAAPTSLAVDVNAARQEDLLIIIGYADGKFSCYKMNKETRALLHWYTYTPESAHGKSAISALAYSSPYLLMTASDSRMMLFALPQTLNDQDSPTLLSSLRSYTAYPPSSLALKTTGSCVTASIAFALPGYLNGWTMAIQEVRLSSSGSILDSRIASGPRSRSDGTTSQGLTSLSGDQVHVHPLSSQPSSISYNHPYLLTANLDNTMTLYLVSSTATKLSISSGMTLWGHTSSISSAHVGARGKAVSVSTRGNDLRVWELEGRGSCNMRTRLPDTKGGIRVQSEVNDSLQPEPADSRYETSKGWIAFDDEKVVLLREKSHGAQAVVTYDFR
ncbi:uncharacterized protein KY384_000328 [Bacidia gigantensis]|uniref:uncharacterized protein n=1 Tax=Bacidia gigantensis TaxID=2732470 RepID=UPI001D03D0AD|nr:uncharacterized protein KY384_000328 [Bacidia gigantensis]KAG8526335.1 hypothetical protein KY384_000328 [Bacidia gigantensis]